MEGPCQQWFVGLGATFVMMPLEHRTHHVQMAEHITQTARQRLLELQASAQRTQRHVGQQRQIGSIAVEFAEELPGVGITCGDLQARTGQAKPERARGIGHRAANMRIQRTIQRLQPGLAVRVLRGLHFLEDIGVTQDRALPEDQQAAGHDVGTFHRDRNRRGLP